MKRWLFLAHRWLGLAGCLLILLWLASGFVMMYVPYPELTDDERLPAMKRLEMHTIRASASDAAAACGTADVLRLRALQPIFAVLSVERLDALDPYYHARSASRPLPVWRALFADPHATWVHIDGRSGQLFSVIDRSKRVARRLYHGLHSWDFQFLLQRRPLRDVLMLAAMAAGFFFSVTSVVIAWRRLTRRRSAARSASPILSSQEQQPCL